MILTMPPASPSIAIPALAATPPTRRLTWAHVGLLLLITLPWWYAVTLPFTHIDDPAYIWRNQHLAEGLTSRSIRWAFTTTTGAFYFPMTWLSLLLDVTLFGHGAAGMHFTNALLHVINTLLLYAFLRQATGSPWRSFLVAAFFTIHPLRVESVAWVTERKDVLSAFFGLLALIAYTAYARAGTPGRRASLYAATCGFFILSLLSKPMLVTLPFLLLLLDLWPLARLTRDNWLRLSIEKLPFLLLTILHALITLSIQTETSAIGNFVVFPISYRVGNAFLSYFLYMRDTVYFQGYSIYYPRYQQLPVGLVSVGVLVFALFSAAAIYRWRRPLPQEESDDRANRPSAFVGWCWYLGTLLPVIGLIPSGTQSRADRFTYWPAIGLFIALIYPWPAAWFRSRPPGPDRRKWVTLLAAAALVVLGFNTAVRLMAWRDPLRLYLDSIANTEHNDWLMINIAAVYSDAGDLDIADDWYRRALTDNPANLDGHYAYGTFLQHNGRWADAYREYAFVLYYRPGDRLARQGLDDVLPHFEGHPPALPFPGPPH
jgi:tetratricopeptide (TPR) repeat protein